MKKVTILLATAFTVLAFASCSKDDISKVTITEAEKLAIGSWKVNYYYDNSDGVSNDFNGYTFDINTDGTVVAHIGGTDHYGTWLIKNSDDDPNYDKEIEFVISGDAQMDKLDGKWLITEVTDTTLKLKDDTPSEEIHFTNL